MSFIFLIKHKAEISHPYDINRLDGNVSCDLHCTHPLHRDTVLEGVEVIPLDFDLQQNNVFNVKQTLTKMSSGKILVSVTLVPHVPVVLERLSGILGCLPQYCSSGFKASCDSVP